MTTSYVVSTHGFQLFTTDTSWFARTIANWRTELRRRRTIAELRRLDPEILDDIGVDRHALGCHPPLVVRAHPTVLALTSILK